MNRISIEKLKLEKEILPFLANSTPNEATQTIV